MDQATTLITYEEVFLKANKSIDNKSLISAAEILLSCVESDAMIYTCGNGGSASTASHFAVDLGVGSCRKGVKLRTLSLPDNVGVITATGNDLDFNSIYAKQLHHLGRKGDVLLLISASGNSRNLINAADSAKEQGIHTISLTGFDGGYLKNNTDLNIHVESPTGAYGIVEDLHLSICHRITELVRLRKS